MSRIVVLDTETTGLDAESGHRIIEIGCIELVNRKITGQRFHYYLNPQREVDEGAFRVHGLSTSFLQDKPLFSSIVAELIDFISGSEVVIHNAIFDVKFLDAELARLTAFKAFSEYCSIKDTLVMARAKHPGQKNNLDALCKRYKVDNQHRELHGALLDADILARVYLAMTGGQVSFDLSNMPNKRVKPETHGVDKAISHQLPSSNSIPFIAKTILATKEELLRHQARMEKLAKKSNKVLDLALYDGFVEKM